MAEHKKKRHWPAIIISLACALIFIISSMTFTAPDSEYVVVTRFGASEKIASEGLNFKWPYPMEDTVRLDKRIQHFERPLTQTALADVRNLLVSVSAEWKIEDPQLFLKTVNSVKNADNFMKNIIGTPTGNVFPKYSLNTIYTTNRKAHKLEEIRREILDQANLISVKYGIKVLNVGFTQSAFPPSATGSIFKMMISERKRKAEQLRNSGKKEAEKKIRQGKVTASNIETAAEIEAENIRAQADLKATEIYKSFQNPQLVAFLRQLDSLKKILSVKANTQLVIDMNTPPFNLLKGSFLEEMKKQYQKDK